MTKPEIISETPTSMAELKEELKKIKKRDDGLNFRAEQTEEYLNQFVMLKNKDAKDIFKKVEDLGIPRLKQEHIIKLIDIMPDNPEEVKTILQGYTVTVTKENIKKLADLLKANAPKEKIKAEDDEEPEKKDKTDDKKDESSKEETKDDKEEKEE